MSKLVARDVVFAYGEKQVLQGVSVALEAGRVLGIIGTNGSGKSTLVKCLDGLLKPASGTVELDGASLESISPKDRAKQIAYVSQHSHAPHSTVYEALLLGRLPHMGYNPGAEDFAAVDGVLASFGLADLATRNVETLSGGEYQKVVIARAFVQDADIVLLDEPFNNLDPANQIGLLRLIKTAAQAKNKAVAVVLHDLNVALQWCDDIAVMKAGKLLGTYPAEAITEDVIAAAFDVRAKIATVAGKRVVLVDDAESSPEAGAEPAAPSASERVAAYFDERADEWSSCNKLPKSAKRRLDDILGDIAGARVLDIGCGTGVMLPYYHGADAESVLAIDLSPEMIRVAKATHDNDPAFAFATGDAATMELPAADLAVLYNCYPHFQDKPALAKNLARALPADGRFLIFHSMGRAALNGHHNAIAAQVSTPLKDAITEADIWAEDFVLDTIIDREDCFAISGTRKGEK